MHSGTRKFFDKFLIYVMTDVMECHLTQVIEQNWKREQEKFIRSKHKYHCYGAGIFPATAHPFIG